MNGTELVETPQWSFAPLFGFEEHPAFILNSEIIMHTWIIMAILALFLVSVKCILHHTKLGRFILIQIVSFFIELTQQSLGLFVL